MQLTADGGYVLAGVTLFFGASGYDFYVVKTGPDVLGTEPKSEVIPSQFALFQNFPNPFNSATTISFNLQHESRILLNVFDLTGRSVAKLANGMFNAGSHQVHFNAGALPSGIYIYRLNSNGISQSRKLLLLK